MSTPLQFIGSTLALTGLTNAAPLGQQPVLDDPTRTGYIQYRLVYNCAQPGKFGFGATAAAAQAACTRRIVGPIELLFSAPANSYWSVYCDSGTGECYIDPCFGGS